MIPASSQKAYLLGYDIGSSSVKAALVDADSSEPIAVIHSPEDAMPIDAPQADWAEQHPERWWSHVCLATKKLLEKSGVHPKEIKAIGITYQMHGLVCVDRQKQLVRPSIIWCDSRAVEIGDKAFEEIGHQKCLSHLLNSPGNFTASKLHWVKTHEPHTYERIDKIMLPGDYIGMLLTGEICTTPQGLSEGILWDFAEKKPATIVMDHFGFDSQLLPEIVPAISLQGRVTRDAAQVTGLEEGIPVTYRIGDQPNNAVSLGVLNPGRVAASGGTSGVVYGIANILTYDPGQRLNSFMHINHSANDPRIGLLLCINGAGILYEWLKEHIAGVPFAEMEEGALRIPIGSDGLIMLPFGNGAERMLNNAILNAHILHLDLNRHDTGHLFRAALEGIAHAFVYGIDMMKGLGLPVEVIRAGNDNLFQSRIFSETIATLTGSIIEVVDTTGAVGAARAAGVVKGFYTSISQAVEKLSVVKTYEPQGNNQPYEESFHRWKNELIMLWERSKKN